METFGEKLRLAIEHCGRPREEIARRTGLELHQLEALERDDCSVLTDDESSAEKLRAFAALVSVDADAVVRDFRAEWARVRPQGATAEEIPRLADDGDVGTLAVEAAPVHEEAAAMPRPAPRSRTHRFPLVGLGATALLIAAFVWLRGPGPEELNAIAPSPEPLAEAGPGAPGAPVATPSMPAPIVAPAEQHPIAEPEPTSTTAPPAASRPEVPVDRDGTFIASYGVGTGVEDHVLVGNGTRFPEGARVWFWTDVEGGTPKGTIEHVWLHGGEEVLRVPLRLGGTRWRTQSFKTLGSGSEGDWVVEARDVDGRVLARSEFHCFEG